MITDKIRAQFEEAHGMPIQTALELYKHQPEHQTPSEQSPNYHPRMSELDRKNMAILNRMC